MGFNVEEDDNRNSFCWNNESIVGKFAADDILNGT